MLLQALLSKKSHPHEGGEGIEASIKKRDIPDGASAKGEGIPSLSAIALQIRENRPTEIPCGESGVKSLPGCMTC